MVPFGSLFRGKPFSLILRSCKNSLWSYNCQALYVWHTRSWFRPLYHLLLAISSSQFHMNQKIRCSYKCDLIHVFDWHSRLSVPLSFLLSDSNAQLVHFIWICGALCVQFNWNEQEIYAGMVCLYCIFPFLKLSVSGNGCKQCRLLPRIGLIYHFCCSLM